MSSQVAHRITPWQIADCRRLPHHLAILILNLMIDGRHIVTIEVETLTEIFREVGILLGIERNCAPPLQDAMKGTHHNRIDQTRVGRTALAILSGLQQLRIAIVLTPLASLTFPIAKTDIARWMLRLCEVHARSLHEQEAHRESGRLRRRDGL